MERSLKGVVVIAVQPWNGLATPHLPSGTAAAPAVTPNVAGWLQGPLLVALGGTLAIALARWIPSVVAAGVIAIGGFLSWTAVLWWDWGWQRFLLPLAHDLRTRGTVDLGDGRIAVIVEGSTPVALTWHVAYLAGLVVLLAGVALLRGTRHRGVTLLTLAGAATVALAGVRQATEWGT